MTNPKFTVELPKIEKIKEDELSLTLQATVRNYAYQYYVKKNELLVKTLYKNLDTGLLKEIHKTIDYELRARKRKVTNENKQN